MTRRGGFRPSSGGNKGDTGATGFRLLPRSWSGKSPQNATNESAGQDSNTASSAAKTAAAAVDNASQSTKPQAAQTTPTSPENNLRITETGNANLADSRNGSGFSGWVLSGLAVGGLGVIAIGAFAAYYLFTSLYLGIALKDQPGSIYLPVEFDAIANVTNNMDIIMDGIIEAQVPFKQTLNLPLKGRYTAEVEIDAPVPVKFDVVYDGTIPVDTIADITARADFNFQDVKTYRELELKAKLPMKMALPVQLTAPVDTIIDFKYKGPLIMGLDQTIQADVDTTLNTQLKVKQTVSTPVTAAIPLHVYAPHKPINVILNAPDLKVDIDSLRLELASNPDEPQRVESPWGPVAEEAYHPQASE
jgi:hypothetical protein